MELIFKYFDRLDIAWYFHIQGGKNEGVECAMLRDPYNIFNE